MATYSDIRKSPEYLPFSPVTACLINCPANNVDSTVITINTVIHISHISNSSLNQAENPFECSLSKKFLKPPPNPLITISASIIRTVSITTV